MVLKNEIMNYSKDQQNFRQPAKFNEAKALILKCGGLETISKLPPLKRLALNVSISRELGYKNAMKRQIVELKKAEKKEAKREMISCLINIKIEKREYYPLIASGNYFTKYSSYLQTEFIKHVEAPNFKKAATIARKYKLLKEDVKQIAIEAHKMCFDNYERYENYAPNIAEKYGLEIKIIRENVINGWEERMNRRDYRDAIHLARKYGLDDKAQEAVIKCYDNININEINFETLKKMENDGISEDMRRKTAKTLYKRNLLDLEYCKLFHEGHGCTCGAGEETEEMKKIAIYFGDYEKRYIHTKVECKKIEFLDEIRREKKRFREKEKQQIKKKRAEKIKKVEAMKIKKAEKKAMKEVRKNIDELLKRKDNLK